MNGVIFGKLMWSALNGAISEIKNAMMHDLHAIQKSQAEFVSNAKGGQTMNPYYNQPGKLKLLPTVVWNWL